VTGTVHENQAGERYVKLTQTHNIRLFNPALVMYRPSWARAEITCGIVEKIAVQEPMWERF
jgi:hypothetical protein